MNSTSKLIVRFLVGFVVVFAMLFVPAGSIGFWQAWMFLGIVFIPVISFSFYLNKHDPQLIARRLESKEKSKEQRLLIAFLKPIFFAALLLPGLDHRLGWSRRLLGPVPPWLSLVSAALVLGGLLLVFWVFQVNTFAARTVRVETSQKVISNGPYRMVRHPMYSGSVVMFLFTPLALGSYVALPAFVLLIPIYVLRLLDEEKFLKKELPGYADYCLRTRNRLIPGVW